MIALYLHLCVFVCVFVCMCVLPPLHTVPSPPEHRGAQRRESCALCSSVFLAPVLRFFFSSSKTNGSSSPRCKAPSSFPLRLSSLGSSHAAVKAQDTGRFVIDQAAARWIWRVLGTQTRSPLRYLPPKLNSRFLAGEYRLLFIYLTAAAAAVANAQDTFMRGNALYQFDAWHLTGSYCHYGG